MRNPTVFPRLIAAIAALCIIGSIFIPYVVLVRANDSNADIIFDLFGHEKIEDNSDTILNDIRNLSLYRIGIWVYQIDKANGVHDAYFALMFIVPGILGLLALLFILTNTPIFTMLFTLLNAGLVHYVINAAWESHIAESAGELVWGPAHITLFVSIVVLAIMSIVMFIAKIKLKRIRKKKRYAK